MTKTLHKIALGCLAVAYTVIAQAQCPDITCTPHVTDTNDVGMCDAVVTFVDPVGIDTCAPVASQTFSYTGTEQTFTVPAGVTSITVDAYGAQGGSNSPSTNVNFGGYVQADIAVTPGSTIYVYVGEQPTGLPGGFNGGGNGETAGAGGGGASDIRIGGNTYAERVVVAGGAGGGGLWSGQEVHGGEGGGLIGGPGYRTSTVNPGGDPGTQTLSGNGTCVSLNNPAVSGGFGVGGGPSGCGCEGYGGGGGWYGGAGSGNCRGGGGGSSYTDPAATNVTHTQGVRTGNGEVTISWVGAGGVMTQITGLASGSTFPVGVTTNTFVFTSGGVDDTCSFNVTVLDLEAPVVTCPMNVTDCEGATIITAATSTDNCIGDSIVYTLSGATTASNVFDLSTVTFNAGTTTVTTVALDAAGNSDSCSFEVVMNALPTVSLASFSVDTLCVSYAPIALPTGTPTSGTYTGTGISGTDFDPLITGVGTYYITYTYTDSLGCVNSDSSAIVVDGCAGIDENNALTSVKVYPNPTTNVITIDLGNHKGSVDYSLVSLEGKVIEKVYNVSTSEIVLDLSQELAGVYLLRIDDNTSFKITKVVKQ